MAGLVVENTKKILFDNGPNLIREDYWEEHPAQGKDKGWLGRLQATAGPHKSGGDPHIAGRALDIVLFSDRPAEKMIADQLVNIFLQHREKMKWISVIYNSAEWNKFGGKMPRGGDAINRHLTHIHIEWDSADMNLTGFEGDLAASVKNINDPQKMAATDVYGTAFEF